MVERQRVRVVDERVGELLQLGEAEARRLRVVAAAVLPLVVDPLVEGEVWVARLGDVGQLHGGGKVGGDGTLRHRLLLAVLTMLIVKAMLRVLIVLAELIVLQVVIVVVTMLVVGIVLTVLAELIVWTVLIVLAVLIVWAVPAVRVVLTVLAVLAALAVLTVLAVPAVAGGPLHHHAALWRLDVAVRRRAQAVLLNHAAAAGVDGGHLLAHGAAALGQAAGGDAAVGAAVLGGACPADAAPHGGVVAAGVLVVLRGALNAAQITEAAVHHLLGVIGHGRHIHHGARLHVVERGHGDGAVVRADLCVAALQDGDSWAVNGAYRLAGVGLRGGEGAAVV